MYELKGTAQEMMALLDDLKDKIDSGVAVGMVVLVRENDGGFRMHPYTEGSSMTEWVGYFELAKTILVDCALG